MYARTLPREIAARWIKAGDEVAMYEVEDGRGEEDSLLRDFCRTEELVTRFTLAEWWLVVSGAQLVPEPVPEWHRADTAPGEGFGWWRTRGEPPIGYPPAELDHVGAVQFVVCPVTNDRIGAPRSVWAKPEEQFVIRERVKVDALELMLDETRGTPAADAVALRLLIDEEPAEGQRVSAGITVAERPVRTPEQIRDVPPHERTREEIYRYGTHGPFVQPLPVYRVETMHPGDVIPRRFSDEEATVLAQLLQAAAGDAPREVGEVTVQLPMRRIPMGILGLPMGRTVEESDATTYERERNEE